MSELQVLHILPRFHSGGAASITVMEAQHAHARGSAIHRALALEPGGATILVRKALAARMRLHIAPAAKEEETLVRSANVIVVHYWNTPSMRRFFDRWRGRALRWVLHVHVNGVHQPQRLPPALAASAGHVVLTNPRLIGIVPPQDVSVVAPAADLGAPQVASESGERGSIAHVGTLNVFKLSPHFVPLHAPIASAVDPVQVIGSGGDEERFRAEATALGVGDGFAWLGFRSDLRQLYARIRLLSYPVAPFSYASSDKVIQECQAAGVPVLVQRDAPVAHQVRDGVSGILAADLDDFRHKLIEIAAGRLALPDRRTVSAAAREVHDPQPKLDRLEAIYRSVEAGPVRTLDDGFTDLLAWLDYQIGDVADLPDARRPPLSELRDDAVLARHQRWACEGGLAQYLNAFPELGERLSWSSP